MNRHYSDILSRISQKPIWFDEYAVPRFEKFHPMDKANIYAYECVLLEIQCQGCGTRFDVCMSHDSMHDVRKVSALKKLIKTGEIHYGDPPNIECCPAGPTMNSVPQRVLEYWKINDKHDWERDATLEVRIEGW